MIWRLRAGTVGNSYMGMLSCSTAQVPGNWIGWSKTLPFSGFFQVLCFFRYLLPTPYLVHRDTLLLSKVSKTLGVSLSVHLLSTGVMVLMGLRGCLWQSVFTGRVHSAPAKNIFPLCFPPAWASVTVKTEVRYFPLPASTIPEDQDPA